MQASREYYISMCPLRLISKIFLFDEAELVPEGAFDDTILPGVAVDATHLERLRHLQMYSAMVIPLVARGRTLGAMTLVLHGPERRRAFDAEDLALAVDLGRRAGLALENARLFEAERRARTEAARARADTEQSAELTQRLQEVTATFARTIGLREVADTTLSQGIDALSAESGAVYLMNAPETALDLVAFRGMPERVVERYVHVTLDMPLPVTAM